MQDELFCYFEGEPCIKCSATKYLTPVIGDGFDAYCTVCGKKYYMDYVLVRDGVEWYVVPAEEVDKGVENGNKDNC